MSSSQRKPLQQLSGNEQRLPPASGESSTSNRVNHFQKFEDLKTRNRVQTSLGGKDVSTQSKLESFRAKPNDVRVFVDSTSTGSSNESNIHNQSEPVQRRPPAHQEDHTNVELMATIKLQNLFIMKLQKENALLKLSALPGIHSEPTTKSLEGFAEASFTASNSTSKPSLITPKKRRLDKENQDIDVPNKNVTPVSTPVRGKAFHSPPTSSSKRRERKQAQQLFFSPPRSMHSSAPMENLRHSLSAMDDGLESFMHDTTTTTTSHKVNEIGIVKTQTPVKESEILSDSDDSCLDSTIHVLNKNQLPSKEANLREEGIAYLTVDLKAVEKGTLSEENRLQQDANNSSGDAIKQSKVPEVNLEMASLMEALASVHTRIKELEGHLQTIDNGNKKSDIAMEEEIGHQSLPPPQSMNMKTNTTVNGDDTSTRNQEHQLPSGAERGGETEALTPPRDKSSREKAEPSVTAVDLFHETISIAKTYSYRTLIGEKYKHTGRAPPSIIQCQLEEYRQQRHLLHPEDQDSRRFSSSPLMPLGEQRLTTSFATTSDSQSQQQATSGLLGVCIGPVVPLTDLSFLQQKMSAWKGKYSSRLVSCTSVKEGGHLEETNASNDDPATT